MKIFLTSTGDWDVGIPGTDIMIQANLDNDSYDEGERRKARKRFIDFFKSEFDMEGTVDVWWGDECPTCHQKLNKDRVCPNINCIENCEKVDDAEEMISIQNCEDI